MSSRVRFPRRRWAGVFVALVALAAGISALATRRARSASGEPNADTHAVWLYLDSSAARSDAPPVLNELPLAQRRAAGLPIFDTDRPIPPHLVAAIARTGAEVRVQSRWLRAVSVQATPAQLRALRRLPFVRRLAPVRRGVSASGPRLLRSPPVQLPAAGIARSAIQDSSDYGVNYRIMAKMGIPLAHELRLSGQGVGIAILDTGFERQHEALSGRILGAQRDFINGDGNVANEPGEADQERHGTQVWSLVGGLALGRIRGPAYNATFFLAKVDAEPGDTEADEDRWVAGAEWAGSLGARIISSSVYFRSDFTDRPAIDFFQLNGDSTATTKAANVAARSNILVVQAIGDAPPASGSLNAPADARGILAVGAVDTAGKPWNAGGVGSARGPTADARPKPEVVGVGVGVAAASSITGVGLDFGLEGTSFSTPLIAGVAALLMEAWPTLSAAAIRSALMLAGDNTRNFDSVVGYGLPDLGAAIMMPSGLAAGSISPRDVSGSPTSLAPVFSWNAPQQYPGLKPITFTLDLARDSLFEQRVAKDSVDDAQALTLRAPLTPGDVLWWRVTAESPQGIRRRSNVAGPFTVPHWVTLLTLAGDQLTFTETTRPQLAWDPLEAPAPIGPLMYVVEVLDHATSQVVYSLPSTTDTIVTVPSPGLAPDGAYRWRVITRTQQGRVDTVTSVAQFFVDSGEAPPATILYQNFPNPFPNFDLGMTQTRIWFDLAESAIVELTVHDLRGRLLRSLIPAQPSCSIQRLAPGLYGRPGSPNDDPDCIKTTWDGRDHNGERLPRGVYVLRLLTNGKPEYRRMLYQPN